MVSGVEDHQTTLKIKIARPDFWHGDAVILIIPVKIRNTILTDTRFVLQLDRNSGDQFIRNLYLGAPARAFVKGDSARLAVVALAAQRAFSRIQGFSRLSSHFSSR